MIQYYFVTKNTDKNTEKKNIDKNYKNKLPVKGE